MTDYEQGSKEKVPLEEGHIGFTVIQNLELPGPTGVCPGEHWGTD